MTREQLTRRVALRLGVRAGKAKPLVDAFCETMIEALANNENVVLSNFGTFEVIHRRSMHTKSLYGRDIIIKDPVMVSFSTSRKLKRILNDRQD